MADVSKLPPLLIFNGQPSPKGKPQAANSIEREVKNYKDKKGSEYYRGVLYAVTEGMAQPAGFQRGVGASVWSQCPWCHAWAATVSRTRC